MEPFRERPEDRFHLFFGNIIDLWRRRWFGGFLTRRPRAAKLLKHIDRLLIRVQAITPLRPPFRFKPRLFKVCFELLDAFFKRAQPGLVRALKSPEIGASVRQLEFELSNALLAQTYFLFKLTQLLITSLVHSSFQ